MSRNIDWEQPLSDEDRAWAAQFSRHTPLIADNDAKFAGDDGGALGGEDLGGGDGDEKQPSIDDYTVAELQGFLKDKGLPTSGTKSELWARLQAASV